MLQSGISEEEPKTNMRPLKKNNVTSKTMILVVRNDDDPWAKKKSSDNCSDSYGLESYNGITGDQKGTN